MPWEPLPEGEGANPLIRRLKAIDAEIYGNFYAHSGTIGGDVTIQGNLVGNDMYSANWNGAIPANLSSISSATAGYYLDGSVGAAQFSGNLFVRGDLQMAGYGWLKTNVPGTYRAELSGAGLYFVNSSNTTIASLQSVSTGFNIYGDVRFNNDINIKAAGVESGRFEMASDYSGTTSWLDVSYFDDWNSDYTIARYQAAGTGSAGIVKNFYAASFMFIDETTTGWRLYSTNQAELIIGGTREILCGSSGFKVQNVYDSTDPTAANVFVNTDGGLYRSTSSIRYKNNVRDAAWLASVPLRPVAYTSKVKAGNYFGLIAEEVAEALPEAAIFSADGQDIEDYDTRAVIAVMVAKINRLEKRLEEYGINSDSP